MKIKYLLAIKHVMAHYKIFKLIFLLSVFLLIVSLLYSQTAHNSPNQGLVNDIKPKITERPPVGKFNQKTLSVDVINEWIKGSHLISNGRYAEGMSAYLYAASLGDATSAYEIGRMLQNGNNFPKDLELALAWYQFAANNGNPLALLNVAVMKARGLGGLSANIDSSIIIQKKAYTMGSSQAAQSMAICYKSGYGVQVDKIKEDEWNMNLNSLLMAAKYKCNTEEIKKTMIALYSRMRNADGFDLAEILAAGSLGMAFHPNDLKINDIAVSSVNGPYETECDAVIENTSSGGVAKWHFMINERFINGKAIQYIKAATFSQWVFFGQFEEVMETQLGVHILPGFHDLEY